MPGIRFGARRGVLLKGAGGAPAVGPAGLYAFTNATFTPGTQTGSTGPDLTTARAGLTGTGVDAWKTNTSYFNTSSGIQLWTVPQTASYSFKVVGATGANINETATEVGCPADIRGTFSLTQGDVLKILCGQPGWLGDPRPGWGGGGGSFVTTSDNTPLFVAGGTGGPHTVAVPSATIDASLTTTGQISQAGLSAATGGAGASGNGGGGAGLTGNGTCLQIASYPGVAGISFTNGGAGANRGGGFGGGGGCTNTYGGGGGGYSGGQGGYSGPWSGGGGGSFISASATSTSAQLYTNSRTTMVAGFVIITKL